MNIQRDTEYRYGEMSLAPNYNDTSAPNYINKLLRELGADSLDNVVLWCDGSRIWFISTNVDEESPNYVECKTPMCIREEYKMYQERKGFVYTAYRASSVRYNLPVNLESEVFDKNKCSIYQYKDIHFAENVADKYVSANNDLLDQLDGKVIVKRFQFPQMSFDFVDLGLPSGTQWATKNIGATNETDTGLYFAWGEMLGYDDASIKKFSKDDYVLGKDWPYIEGCVTNDYAYFSSGNLFYKSNTQYVPGYTNNISIPSTKDMQELMNNTTVKYYSNYNNSNVSGYLVTSNINGNSVFFPSTGYYKDGRIEPYTEDESHTWGDSVSEYRFWGIQYAAELRLHNSDYEMGDKSQYRYCGLPIRLVNHVHESMD